MAVQVEKLTRAIMEKVGGEENVSIVTHCVTRLRFILKNVELADTEGIKALDGVLGAVSYTHLRADGPRFFKGIPVHSVAGAVRDGDPKGQREPADHLRNGGGGPAFADSARRGPVLHRGPGLGRRGRTHGVRPGDGAAGAGAVFQFHELGISQGRR